MTPHLTADGQVIVLLHVGLVGVNTLDPAVEELVEAAIIGHQRQSRRGIRRYILVKVVLAPAARAVTSTSSVALQ